MDAQTHKPTDFDETLLETSLKRNVQERVEFHDSALEVVLEFRRAGRAYYEEQEWLRQRSVKSNGIT